MHRPSDRSQQPVLLLGFFLLLHVLNQVDRNLIASFGPEIVRDLGLSRTEFGIVTGVAFTAFYAVTALGAGVLADRYGRTRILAFGLATWSGFTALSGMARSFVSLVSIRPLVATGEATLIPAATAILSERFPAARRATAIGVFFMGVPLGVGASFFLAGQLGPVLGWRGVFVLLGLIGLIFVAGVLALRDRTTAVAHGAHEPLRSASAVLTDLGRELRANADLRLSLAGSVLMHLYLAGGPFVKLWLVEERGFAGDRIAMTYGLAVVVFGVIGAALGGTLADWYARRWRGGRAALPACQQPPRSAAAPHRRGCAGQPGQRTPRQRRHAGARLLPAHPAGWVPAGARACCLFPLTCCVGLWLCLVAWLC